jgi:predicted O-methyltransferase YrrM
MACLDRIVELGTYEGRSTVALASGLARASFEEKYPVLTIDTFTGSYENQPGERHFRVETLTSLGHVDTYPAFTRNIKEFGLTDLVCAWRMTTIDAAELFEGNIGLLFVDGDHSYEAVRGDLDAWVPHLAHDGIVVLHDVGDWEGPTRAAADLLGLGFGRISQVETTLVLSKPSAKRR